MKKGYGLEKKGKKREGVKKVYGKERMDGGRGRVEEGDCKIRCDHHKSRWIVTKSSFLFLQDNIWKDNIHLHHVSGLLVDGSVLPRHHQVIKAVLVLIRDPDSNHILMDPDNFK